MRRLTLALLGLLMATQPSFAQTPDIRFFQLGTGPTGETRFPIGGLIANALSNPPGSRECAKGGSCGVPGMVAVAKSTGGSIANVEAIANKRLDAALVHSDIAYWAFHGSGIYKAKGAVQNLRGIAMLYPESLHLVVRKDAAIKSVRDLKGKRVSFGEKDSSTQVHGKMLLGAFGLNEKQVKLTFLKPGPSADALAEGKLDAMLVVDAYPVPTIAELAKTTEIDIVPITGKEVDKLLAQQPFLRVGSIPAALYQGVHDANLTLDVGVALVTGAEQPDQLIYEVTKALWQPSTQKLLAEANNRGKLIKLDAEAISKMGIPLHGGASAYYFDAGINP